MKKLQKAIILILFTPLSNILFAQHIDSTIEITGKIGNLKAPAKVHLSYNVNGELLSAVGNFDEKGVFRIQTTINNAITDATLILNENNLPFDTVLTTINRERTIKQKVLQMRNSRALEPGSRIVISSPDNMSHATVTGLHMEALKEKELGEPYLRYRNFVNNILKAPSLDKREELISEYNAFMKNEFTPIIIKAAMKYKTELTGLELLNMLNYWDDETRKEILAILNTFPKSQKESYKASQIRALAKRLDEKTEKENNHINNTAIGTIIKNFTINDINDQPVSITDYKGKYVLIDFWASWCIPCRAENPNIIKAYNTFKSKNFTILGISLDSDKNAWLKAIKKDHLPWTQVSELNLWSGDVVNLFGIKSIPYNLLIDPSGKIIAKNLREEDLHKQLSEILQ